MWLTDVSLLRAGLTGNLHKLLNLWRNEDRIQLESCQVVKGGLRVVRAVLAIDTTEDNGPRGGRW